MNSSVRELESLRPRLRDDLHFSVQEHSEDRVCVIEDAAASKYYRVGFDEYRFFRSLDGTQTVAAILSRLARDAKGETYSEHEALQMLRWLKDNNYILSNPMQGIVPRGHSQPGPPPVRPALTT